MRLQGALVVALACFCATVLTSCNTGKGVTDESSQHAALRVINLVFNAGGPINVMLDSDTIVSGLAFEGQTSYQEIGIGTKTIQPTVPSTASNAASATVANFLGATNYTYVAFGPAGNAAGILLTDSTIDPGAGNFALRVLNAAIGSGALDIYVTPPGASLDTTTPTIGGIAAGNTTVFVLVPAGNVQIRITPTGSKEVIFDSLPQSIAERAEIEGIIYARGSGKLVNLALLNLDNSGTGSILNSLLAQFKIINGSSVASPLNVFVNHDLVLSNIPYTGASGYQKTAAGTPTLTIESTATPGATLLTLMPNLLPATDSSIVLTGPAGALQSLVLADNNLPPAAVRARVRFVNSSADVPAVDVFVNFSRQVASLAMNTASPGIEYDADSTLGTSYEVDFNVSGSTLTSLSLPAVILTGGHSYSIYLVGSRTALAAVVTQDN
jgi:hypothetical protein